LAPAATADLIQVEDLVATLAVGTSGAGRAAKPDLLATEVMGSARAYSVAGSHRHIPEMLQNLAIASGKRGSISFTPILVPMTRGIFATVAAKPGSRFSMEYIREVYQDAYGDEEFVKLLPPGEVPQTGAVLGSNMAHVTIEYDERAGRVLFMCAIDNLVKGTAGAAIQSMNIALGLTEQTGLTTVGVAP
jgi:N-acetyl-gamma-glutamyl-phosphate reductase